jgi:hypothetical protein
MIDRPDLDPQDYKNRTAVRDQLKQIRRQERLSCRALGDLAGWSQWTVDHLEHADNWGIRRIQAWSRALGHQFRMTITGLTVPDDGDFEAELLKVTTAFGALDEDNLHTQAIVLDLARIRRGMGLTRKAFAAQVSVGNHVRGWEDEPTRCLVKTVQRYARGLGGELALEVVPVDVMVTA